MNLFDDLSFAGLARSVAPTFSGGYSLASPGRMVAVTWPLTNSVWGPHVMGVPNAGASAGNRQQPAGRRWGEAERLSSLQTEAFRSATRGGLR